MNRQIRWIMITAGILVMMTCTSFNATTAAVADSQEIIPALQRQVSYLELRIQDLNFKRRTANQELESAKTRVSSGLAPSSELPPLELKLMELEIQLSQTEMSLVDALRIAALAKPVDVEMKSADIRQVAETLSRVSTVKIIIDENVPTNLYVTTQAKDVPLGAVLETVANSANLIIDPGKGGSIVLSNPWKLQVNGKQFDPQNGNWPWSDNWAPASYDDSYYPLGRRWLRVIDSSSGVYLPSDAQQTGVGISGKSVRSPQTSSGTVRSSQAALTALGPNALVVSEPGSGPNGEPGFWLTFYNVKNGKLTPGTRYFHRSSSVQVPAKKAPAK